MRSVWLWKARGARHNVMFVRRSVVLLIVASLLAGVGAVSPSGVQRTVAAETGRTWYVGPGAGAGRCGATVDFRVGAVDSSSGAIQRAVAAATSGDTIFLCDHTYELTSGISVDKDLTFRGETTTGTILDGRGSVRILTATENHVTVTGMTMRNGNSGGGVRVNDGGAIRADAVTIRGALFQGNQGYEGGAVATIDGNLDVADAVFTGNQAESGAALFGLMFGAITVTRTTFSDNTANSVGGAIDFFFGTLTVTDSRFERNRSVGQGGAIFSNNLLTVTDSVFLDNTGAFAGAIYASGDAVVNGGTFEGNTATSIYGGSVGRGGAIASYGSATIADAVFRDNHATGNGGAVSAWGSVSVTGSSFSGNSGNGSGGAVQSVGAATISGSTFTENTANSSGGAVSASGGATVTGSSFTGNTGNQAGALNLAATSTIVGSTFHRNSTPNNGGAIYLLGSGTAGLTVANSTFVENTAATSGAGSGGNILVLAQDGPASLTTTNATFVQSAPGSPVTGGNVRVVSTTNNGGYSGPALVATLTARDSLFVGGTCDLSGYDDDVLNDQGVSYRDASSVACPGSARTASQLDLRPLADNGGLTSTVALGQQSVARDAVPPVNGACPTGTDQRGVARPVGAGCDVGAFESNVRYVKPTSGPVPAGCETGFATVQAAVDAADDGLVVRLCAGTHELTAGVVVPWAGLTIEGDGSASTTVDGTTAHVRLFDALGRAITFRDLTLRGGDATTGGAVRAGDVSAESVRFRDNRASGTGPADGGGAISASGTVSVTDGEFAGNNAAGSGGAIRSGGVVTSRGNSYTDNTSGTSLLSSDRAGGAIRTTEVTSTDDVFQRNVARTAAASARGGAIHASGDVSVCGGSFLDNSAATGGAVSAVGSIELVGGTVSGNRAATGGAIYADVDVALNGTVAIGNAATEHGGFIYAGADVAVAGGHYASNRTQLYGGAIFAGGSLSTVGGEFVANVASSGDGGTGIGGAAFASYTAVVDGTLFRGNSAAIFGGALSGTTIETSAATFRENTAGIDGGAIEGMVVTVHASALIANVAGRHAGAIRGYNGTITASESLFSANRAISGSGGAIGSQATIALSRNTFVGNRANANGGAVAQVTATTPAIFSVNETYVANVASVGGAVYGSSTMQLAYDTFADNTAGSPGSGAHVRFGDSVNSLEVTGVLFVGGDCTGLPTANGTFTTSPSCPGTVVSRSALALGSLDLDAGVRTLALARGSVAIDPMTGQRGYCGLEVISAPTDGRGEPRPALARCDSGAYEFQDSADRTTGILVRAYVDGVEVTAGQVIDQSKSITVVAEVSISDGTDADLTAGQVDFRLCRDAVSTPATCPLNSESYPYDAISVTEGTVAGDHIAVARFTELAGNIFGGWYRVGAFFAIPGGEVAGSEATANTPTFRLIPSVDLRWDATAGVVQTGATVPLRARAVTPGGLVTSGCPVTFTVADLGGVTVATASATSNDNGYAATSVAGLTTPGIYVVSMTTGDACASPTPGWGVLNLGPTARPSKSTVGAVAGGKHFFLGYDGTSASFGLRVDSTSGAIAKGSKVIGYRTNIRFAWVSSDGWRLIATTTGDFTSNTQRPPWLTASSCASYTATDGTGAPFTHPRGTVCGSLVFQGALQRWDAAGRQWGAGTNVTFEARIADGGSARTGDNTDWFGVRFVTAGPPSLTSLRPVRMGATSGAYLGRAFVF